MKKLISFFVVLMGISCFSGQVLFIREFLIIFYGNELTIGLILANWLLLEATGSYVFGLLSSKLRSPATTYIVVQTLIGILFPLSIAAVRTINLLLKTTPGQGLGITPIFLCSFIIMLPLGFLLGGQFPLACRLHQDINKKTLTKAIGSSYFQEALGFGLGGIIVTYFFIPFVHSLKIAFLIGWINIICAWILFSIKKKNVFKLCGTILLVIIGIIGYTHTADILQSRSLQMQWQDFNLIDYQNSKYGNIAVTKQQEQYVFYYDGVSFMSIPTPDVVFTEDMVNFAMAAADSHDRVGIIGSGLGGIINLLLQFPVQDIDYAEIDPLVIEMAKRYTTPLTLKELANKKLHIHHTDGRLFLKNSPETFNVIIMNLPIPSTLIINRFYTLDFFRIIKSKLKTNGLFCLSLPGTLSYLSNEQIDINKCILQTLKTVFTSVEVIPGYYNIYLASNNKEFKLTPAIIKNRLKDMNIQSVLFTEFYIKERLNPQLKNWFYESLMKRNVRINKDLEPVGVFYSLSLWNALFTPAFQKIFQLATKLNLKILISVFLLPLVVLLLVIFYNRRQKINLLKGKIIPLLVLASGFSGVSINLILLLSLQTFYGYVYLHIGLLISCFMIGLTSGSMLMTNILNRIKNDLLLLLKIDVLFALFCFALYPVLLILQNMIENNILFNIIIVIFSCLCIISGFFVGVEFPLANKIYLNKKQDIKRQKNILYALDMLGSFFGAILVSIILIPVLGIINTVIFVSFVKIALIILLATNFSSLAQ